MNIEDFRNYCLAFPYAEETLPFDETTLVYKVGGKMFAVGDMESFDRIVVKCEPEEAEALRERYPEVTEAWHFNKRWWNALPTAGDLPESFLREQIRNSYLLVVQRNVTPRSLRDEIEAVIAAGTLPE